MNTIASIFGFIKGKKSRSREYLDEGKLPPYIIYTTIIVCLAPTLLNLCGVNFGSLKVSLSEVQSQKDILHFVNGAFAHSLLEWSSFTIVFLTVLLSLSHYFIAQNPTILIFGITILCAGSMDAFHILAATHLVEIAVPNQDFIPFSWALCRFFNSTICLIGALFILVSQKHLKKEHKTFFIVAISCALVIIFYVVIHSVIASENLPQTQFPDTLISRPWDIYPAIVFTLTIPIYLMLFYREPNPFVHSLLIKTIPDLAVQLHMVFGSETLFDNHFNIAHFLKIISYLVIFIGLGYDYTKISHFVTSLYTKTKSLIDTNPSTIITINEWGIIQDANPYTTKMFGYSREELIGKNVSVLVAPPHQEKHDGYLANYLRTGVAKIIGTSGRDVFCLKKMAMSSPQPSMSGSLPLMGKSSSLAL